MDKINFVERFVFVYDTLKDGLGVLYDLYEMFHIEGENSLYQIFLFQAVKMTQDQYSKIAKMMKENAGEVEIVFYELNKIPTLAFFGEDYIELTDKIYASQDRYLKLNNYKKLETTPEIFNGAKNDLRLKYLRYAICNPQTKAK